MKTENQEKRLYYLEKQARQRNVVFFGIEETETSYLKLESNLIEFIKKILCNRTSTQRYTGNQEVGKER